MKRLFLAIAILATSFGTLPQPAHAQEESPAPAGSVKFKAEDRLAVINLVSSYGPNYDENRLDLSEQLYWKDAKMVGFVPGKNVATPTEFFEWAKPRRAKLQRNGIQMRHFITPMIASQTETTVTGIAYLQKYWIKDGKISLDEMGYYKFEATKKGDEWRFSRWEFKRDFKSE